MFSVLYVDLSLMVPRRQLPLGLSQSVLAILDARRKIPKKMNQKSWYM